jgi:hypothetical protein
VPFLKAKNYRNLSLSGQKLSIMILENSYDYRHFDNDKLSIANTIFRPCINFSPTLTEISPTILNKIEKTQILLSRPVQTWFQHSRMPRLEIEFSSKKADMRPKVCSFVAKMCQS